MKRGLHCWSLFSMLNFKVIYYMCSFKVVYWLSSLSIFVLVFNVLFYQVNTRCKQNHCFLICYANMDYRYFFTFWVYNSSHSKFNWILFMYTIIYFCFVPQENMWQKHKWQLEEFSCHSYKYLVIVWVGIVSPSMTFWARI